MPRKEPSKEKIREMQSMGYRYESAAYCEMCGPFSSRFVRTLGDGETRCYGCDRENEQ